MASPRREAHGLVRLCCPGLRGPDKSLWRACGVPQWDRRIWGGNGVKTGPPAQEGHALPAPGSQAGPPSLLLAAHIYGGPCSTTLMAWVGVCVPLRTERYPGNLYSIVQMGQQAYDHVQPTTCGVTRHRMAAVGCGHWAATEACSHVHTAPIHEPDMCSGAWWPLACPAESCARQAAHGPGLCVWVQPGQGSLQHWGAAPFCHEGLGCSV